MTPSQTLKKLLIKTKKQVFSEIIGNNTSPLKGEGYDFLELKEYEYGEDAKNIDWIISAKMQKPYVKVFHAQKELNIHLVPILNGSLHFGTSKFKQELVTEVCSLLAFSSIKQGDPFCSYIANESIEIITKRSKKIFSVQSMIEQLYTYNVLNKQTNYSNITSNLYKLIQKRSIIFLIGDFFDTKDLDLKLLCQKHEVYVIIIRDKFEENPTKLGQINLIDPQTNQTFDGHISEQNVQEYIKVITKEDHQLYEHLQRCGVKTTKIYTHEEPFAKLIGVLRK